MPTAALVAAAAAAATDGAYVALIRSQNATPPQPGIVAFICGYIAAIAAASMVGVWCYALGRPAAAKAVFLAAAAGSATLGFLAIFSIGLALLITAALLSIAALSIPRVDRPNAWLWPVSGALIAVVALLLGFFIVGTFG